MRDVVIVVLIVELVVFDELFDVVVVLVEGGRVVIATGGSVMFSRNSGWKSSVAAPGVAGAN